MNNECCTDTTGCNIGCIVSKAEADTRFAYKNDCINGTSEGCFKPNYMWPINGYTGRNNWPGMKPSMLDHPAALTG